ncbi:PaaI family thioesterase [Catenulispora subtropica]|uniref:Hotdog fold thioesterase n=1 Tax=Catenulispora subtropica TaxID=450798 RepID=A0ABP5DAJ2_9ACTN
MTETLDGVESADTADPATADPSGERTRTYSWSDPLASSSEAAGLSGIEYLRAMAEGRMARPPISVTMGIDGLTEVEEGRVVFHMTPAEHHYNPIGSVHGGAFATLLDSACGCAVQSLLPAGDFYTSLDLSVKFLRGMTKDTGPVQCIGTVTHIGRRTALAEARIVDANGKLYATATSSCMVFRAGDA